MLEVGVSKGAIMDLSSVVNMQVRLAQVDQATGQSGSVSAASQLLAPANKRLSQQLDSTNVQLSAYGQIESAFGSVQTSVGGLAGAAISKTASNADVEKVAQAFVNSYNQAAQAVNTAVAGTGKQTGALASDLRAKRAGGDLAQALSSGTGLADLKQAGITQNKNGTLTLDTKALEQALQSSPAQAKSALNRLGQQVGASAGRELASTGNVGAGVSSLTSKAQSLTAQQTTLQQQALAVQNTLDRQSAVLNYAAASGLAAYKNLLG